MGALFLVASISTGRYSDAFFNSVLRLAVGAIVAGFIHALFHELGHLLFGKINGFAFSALSVWFLKWQKKGKKTTFSFTMIGEQSGYTEMVAKGVENLDKKAKRMSMGGIIFSLIFTLVGVIPLFIPTVDRWLYAIIGMLLPIGVYYFLGNALPCSNGGMLNDGGVVYSLGRKTDIGRVLLNILAIQANLYLGKTPGEIDKELYFDIPQLQEDSPYYFMIMNARYNYYLDIGDNENAKKITDRLNTIDGLSKGLINSLKVDELYNACTFAFNPDLADDLVYEIEKYLNDVNTLPNLRAKMAYLLYVQKDEEPIETFYGRCVREAKRCVIPGYAKFEMKLIEKIKDDCIK